MSEKRIEQTQQQKPQSLQIAGKGTTIGLWGSLATTLARGAYEVASADSETTVSVDSASAVA